MIMMKLAQLHLVHVLQRIEENDKNYDVRYGLVHQAVALAHVLGYRTGVSTDFAPSADGFSTVIYIDLPLPDGQPGQVSWHMPDYAGQWDRHTTEEKYARCRTYAQTAQP